MLTWSQQQERKRGKWQSWWVGGIGQCLCFYMCARCCDVDGMCMVLNDTYVVLFVGLSATDGRRRASQSWFDLLSSVDNGCCVMVGGRQRAVMSDDGTTAADGHERAKRKQREVEEHNSKRHIL